MSSNSKKAKAPSIRYGWRNPPPDMETASARTDTLSVEEKTIQQQLDNAEPNDFTSDQEYASWRYRAERALSYIQIELDFLQRWIVNGGKSRPKEFTRPSGPQNLRGIADGIRKYAEQLAEEIGGSYTPTYSPENKPKSLNAAQERMTLLVSTKQRLAAAFSEVNAKWTAHPLRRNELQGVKAPLQNILLKVEQEISIVNTYVKQVSSLSSDWKPTCVGIIERAVTAGVILTPKEQDVFNHLKKIT